MDFTFSMLLNDERLLKKTYCIVLIGSLFLLGSTVSADEGVAKVGKVRYMENCAACHGDDAKGSGDFAPFLIKRPPDLTVLTKSAGGAFPFNRIFDAIDGRTSVGGAHGSKDMPIWGSEWKGASLVSETAVRGRILEIIIYIRSLQQ